MTGMNPVKKRETFDIHDQRVGAIIPHSEFLSVVKGPRSLNVVRGLCENDHFSHSCRALSRFLS